MLTEPGGRDWCFDISSDARYPFDMQEPRDYLDVGGVNIWGEASSFSLTPRNGVDHYGRLHEAFYELILPESVGQQLVPGEDLSIALVGSSAVPEMEALEFARMPEAIVPGGGELEDLTIQRGVSTSVTWSSAQDGYHVRHVLLLGPENDLVVFCTGPLDSEAVELTAEALEAFLEREPGGEGRLVKMTNVGGSLRLDTEPIGVFTTWSTVQRFQIVE